MIQLKELHELSLLNLAVLDAGRCDQRGADLFVRLANGPNFKWTLFELIRFELIRWAPAGLIAWVMCRSSVIEC